SKGVVCIGQYSIRKLDRFLIVMFPSIYMSVNCIGSGPSEYCSLCTRCRNQSRSILQILMDLQKHFIQWTPAIILKIFVSQKRFQYKRSFSPYANDIEIGKGAHGMRLSHQMISISLADGS